MLIKLSVLVSLDQTTSMAYPNKNMKMIIREEK